MKIFIVGPAHPYRGGIAQFNEVMARSLTEQGHTVRIINFTLQYPDILFPGQTQYTHASAPKGLDIVRSINSINPISWIKVGRAISRERPDLVVIRYWMPFMAPALGSIARLASGNGHTRVVALADNIVPHERRWFDRPLTQYFLGGVSGVLYMSEQVGRDLDSFNYHGARACSPHPIYDVYGEPTTKTDACRHLGLDPAIDYTLFFGFIRDYKGLDLLLEAWADLRRRGATTGRKLLIGGEYYGNKQKYDTLIHDLDLSDEVIVHDSYIDESRVRYYFSASDLVAQPYRSATQSGVTQVAYHFGVPMIVTNVGGLSEIVPDGKVGFVVEREPRQIADAIDKFYNTEGLAKQFRENITTEKQRFTWESLTRALMSLTN